MYEYKVVFYKVKEAQNKMNELAKDGWRVIAIMPNAALGYGMVVTFERKKEDSAD